MNELEMRQSALTTVEQAKVIEVNTQQDYDNAAEVCKDIKIRIKAVEEYWKPLKEAAAKQHKDICAREKELLAPFASAETEIKWKMTAFQRQKMEEERLLREEQERFRKEEADRLLKEAEKAEAEGKTEMAEYALEMAQQAEGMRFEQPKAVKTAGTAVKTTWKARVIDEMAVPSYVNGMQVRDINVSALNKIASMVKGKSNIPGVEFYEDISIAVSRG